METKTNNWFAMEPKNEGKSAEISIYDEIGGWGVTAQNFMDSLDSLGEVENIDLRISSPGGSIIEGNVIFNAIKRHAASVTVYIDGMAASMASVIAMAGDEIVMAENALLMIHNPWTVSIGDSEQLRKDADLMDKMKSAIINAYGRSNYDSDELEELMNATTWFTAKEALDAGFIDRIDGELKAAASIADMNHKLDKIGCTLPSEKVIEMLQAKYEETLDALNAEIESIHDQLGVNAATIVSLESKITDLQTENKSLKSEATQMQDTHKAELEQAKTATDEAVANKAAELMALQTQNPVVDSDDDAVPTSSEDLLKQYNALETTKEKQAFRKTHAKAFLTL